MEYQQLSKRRLLEEDDFVIDDDGQGYADYGQDAFERQDDDDLDESDEEDVNDIDGKLNDNCLNVVKKCLLCIWSPITLLPGVVVMMPRRLPAIN